MIVIEVLVKYSSQMLRVENDHMIQTFTTDRAEESLPSIDGIVTIPVGAILRNGIRHKVVINQRPKGKV